MYASIVSTKSSSHYKSILVNELTNLTYLLREKTTESGDTATTTMEDLNIIRTLLEKNVAASKDILTINIDSSSVLQETTRKIENSIHSISSTQESADIISDEFGKLIGDIEGLHEIRTVIRDIFEQTNLLALNVVIEVACEGEHGRVFTVG